MTKDFQALSALTEKYLELELFKKHHNEIFQELKNKEGELESLKKEVQELAKERNEDMENDLVKVTVSERYKKFYDYETVLASVNKTELQTLQNTKAIKHEIDRDVFNECVVQGLIRPEVKQAGFREELISKSAMIKFKI